METTSARNVWEAVLGELELQVSRPNYRTWLHNTVGVSYNGDEFTVSVPNTFVAEYLDRNQCSLIEKTLINILHKDVKVIFTVGSDRQDQKGASLRRGVRIHPESTLRLNPKYTFDSFVVGPCNRLAYAASLEVSKTPGKSYNPLFIYGGPGLGKTHLLQAIGHEVSKNDSRVLYVSGEAFTNDFVSSIQNHQMDSFRHRYREADALLIDDIQFISGKEQTEECFFHTFNELHNGSRQIVMTCDRAPSEVPVLSERLRSRFGWGLAVDMKAPDCDTRREILKLKAESEGANLKPDILDVIAQKIQRNIRELEGSLNRVIAYAKLLQTELTPELASSALADVGTKTPRYSVVASTAVIQAVADCFGLAATDLTGFKRDKETILAREVAIYLLRAEGVYSFDDIGRSLGGRNRSVVSRAYARIQETLSNSPYLKQKISGIQDTLVSLRQNKP